MNERDGRYRGRVAWRVGAWSSAGALAMLLACGGVGSCRKGADSPASAPASKPAPVTKITNGEYDFGLVDPKGRHTVELALPNPAGRRLGVTRVKSECECIVGQCAKGPYEARDLIPVRVTFVAPALPTRYDERLVLVTDDAKRPTIPIRIRANVGLPLAAGVVSVEPAEIVNRKSIEKPVEIVNNGRKPVRLVYSTSSRGGCVARVPRAPVPAGGKLSVPIVIATKELGRDAIVIDIATDLPTQPTLAVTVRMAGAASAPAPGGGQ
ncbi:MAG: DUF1573 domain-containing protein [Planctomycetota bacterium]|nr:DUF1573 domain-containing protein [Planctomycetota bacterium]